MTDVEQMVREILADTYTPEGIEVWLGAQQMWRVEDDMRLAMSARNMIARGDARAVIRRAEYIAGGAW